MLTTKVKQQVGSLDTTKQKFTSIVFLMCTIYETIHIWTAVVHNVDESEEWSSQLTFQIKHLERKSLKKSGLQHRSPDFSGFLFPIA